MKTYLTFPNGIRFGLALVFLANSLTAFYLPGEFQDLVAGSFLAGILATLSISVAQFVTFIGVNDMVVAILLFSGWRLRRVAKYATLWLTGVIFVIGVADFETMLDVLEHFGFLAMALALAF